MSDPRRVPWSVWTARVTFEDTEEIKIRPVVLLDDDVALCICTVLPITSKQKSKQFYCQLKDTSCIKLKKPSMVKLSPIELKHGDLIGYLGVLSETDQYRVERSLLAGSYGSEFL